MNSVWNRPKPGSKGLTFIDVNRKMHSGYILHEMQDRPEHWTPVALLERGTEASMSTTLLREAPMNEQNEHGTISVAKVITIPAKTGLLVVAVASKCGLMTRENVQTGEAIQQILSKRGIHEVCAKFHSNYY